MLITVLLVFQQKKRMKFKIDLKVLLKCAIEIKQNYSITFIWFKLKKIKQ